MTLLPAGLLASLVLAGQAAPPSGPPPQLERDRENAIASIHRRAAAVSPNTLAARLLAAELSEIGRAYLAEGQIGRATELLSEAYGLDEEDGLVLAELTLAYVRAEDFDSARFYLHRAEEKVTRAPPEAFGVLGDVYYALHRLDDAVVAWGECVRFGGQDPPLLRRFARARDELALTRGQRSLAFEHFSIFADPAVSEELVRRAGEHLEQAYRTHAEFFGARLPGPQVVVLYAGRAYFSLVSVPDWVSGLFDGKIRVCVGPEEVVESPVVAVLSHELAHALIRQSSRDRAPGWLHEGLAQYLEGKRLPRREVKAALGRNAARSIEALEGNFHRTLDRVSARSSYAQALSLVEYLIAMRGPGAVACAVASLGEGLPMSDALQAETGLTPAELFVAWKAWAGI
ncbi:MAG: peptidase MA family metallohydrolase [Thermoanaerobaculia bacterium]